MKANKLALATALVALASAQSISAQVIKAIAGQCELDTKAVQNIVDEVMAAKVVAESEMNIQFFQLNPVRSGDNPMNYTDMATSELEQEYSRLMDLLTECDPCQEDDIISAMEMIEDELSERDPFAED